MIIDMQGPNFTILPIALGGIAIHAFLASCRMGFSLVSIQDIPLRLLFGVGRFSFSFLGLLFLRDIIRRLIIIIFHITFVTPRCHHRWNVLLVKWKSLCWDDVLRQGFQNLNLSCRMLNPMILHRAPNLFVVSNLDQQWTFNGATKRLIYYLLFHTATCIHPIGTI